MADETTPQAPDDGRVGVTIDGRELRVPKGTLLVDAATAAGIHIPIYCAHPKMDPVAVCRMCLVSIEKMPKQQPACATVVTDGMVVTTTSDAVAKTREGVLEFLLLNHPLDCPVCDRGGECDLQDFSVRYGPQTSRFPITDKSHANKAVALSDKIELDQERCILCWRCTRYYDEITGEKELVLQQRGVHTVIDSFNNEPLRSDFQGNLPEVCPVGALTHRQYRFKARPWDLQRAKSVCPECSYGCNIHADTRDFEIKRFASRDNPQVDDMWLCDRGRYSVPKWNDVTRVRRPAIRDGKGSRDVALDAAVAEGARLISEARAAHGADSVGVLAGPESTNEELWLVQRIARELIGTPNLDHGLTDVEGVEASDHELGIAEIEECNAVVVLGPEPEQNAPVLTLRLFKAERKRGVTVRRVAADIDPAELREISRLNLVGVIGDESNPNTGDVARALAASNTAVRRLTITRGVNGRGAKDLGILPGYGPGYAAIKKPGLGGAAMLDAAASGKLKVLLLVNADSILAGAGEGVLKALKKASVVAVTSRQGIVAEHATVLIPGREYFEKQGSVTNSEGRVQRIRPALPPATSVPQETRILALLASQLGAEGWSGDPLIVHRELGSAIPEYASAGNGGRALWRQGAMA